jgi:hypothetical protein
LGTLLSPERRPDPPGRPGDTSSTVLYDADDSGKLKIGMTPAGMKRAAEVRRTADDYGIGGEVVLTPVRLSLAELLRKQDDVRIKIMDLISAGHARTSYSPKLNKVIVTALAHLPSREEVRVKRLAQLAWVDMRRIDVPSLWLDPLACNVTYCNPPLRGGREIDGTQAICTASFMARDHTDPSILLAVTAGHCVAFGSLGKWLAQDESGHSSEIGTTRTWVLANGTDQDTATIRINAASPWATPPPLAAVVVKPSAYNTAYDPNYKIQHTSYSCLGQVLCRTGRTTGTECGEVSDLGADDTFRGPGGILYTVKNMGELDMCGALPGDSGSPIYKSQRAYGMLSGGKSQKPIHCLEAYVGVRGAERALSFDLLLAP